MAISWKEMTGQQPRVMRLLHNSIEKKRLSHAYLFEGKKGTGKLDAALLLAKSFFALKTGLSLAGSAGTVSVLNPETIPTCMWFSPTDYPLKRLRSNRFRKSFPKQDWNRIKSCTLYPMRIK